MQEKNARSLKKILLLLALTVFSIAGGEVALVGRYLGYYMIFTSFEGALLHDGHSTFGVSDTFIDPSGFDAYWIYPDESLTDDDITKLYSFVCGGGHLILVPDCRSFFVGPTNRIFEYEPWFEDLGRPQAYNEYVYDSVPDIFISYFGFESSTFILNFDSRWERANGVDTLITRVGVSVGVESDGCLTAVGWGGIDCYGDPYEADTAVYDSFAVQILAGYYRAGEITVVADIDLFGTSRYDQTDIITLFDNLQFARQLFACNQRADSAAIEQEDSTFRVHLHGDFTDFDPDSCEWKFRILHVWPPYQFRGHQLGARYIAPDILEIDYPPIYNPVYDTVEVCLMFLSDSTGETVLWDFPVCDTFVFDFSNIAETPTPQSFTLSAHPNPFNSAVTITAPAGAEVEVFDVRGRKIAQLPVGEGLKPSRSLVTEQTGGSKTTPLQNGEFIWRPDPSLGSGVYLVRIEQSGRTYTKPVVYVK